MKTNYLEANTSSASHLLEFLNLHTLKIYCQYLSHVFNVLISTQLERCCLCGKGLQGLILQWCWVRSPRVLRQMLHLLQANVWPPPAAQLCLWSAWLHGVCACEKLCNLQAKRRKSGKIKVTEEDWSLVEVRLVYVWTSSSFNISLPDILPLTHKIHTHVALDSLNLYLGCCANLCPNGATVAFI